MPSKLDMQRLLDMLQNGSSNPQDLEKLLEDNGVTFLPRAVGLGLNVFGQPLIRPVQLLPDVRRTPRGNRYEIDWTDRKPDCNHENSGFYSGCKKTIISHCSYKECSCPDTNTLERIITLPRKTRLCRYGSEHGRFFSSIDEEYEKLALHYTQESNAYNEYILLEPISFIRFSESECSMEKADMYGYAAPLFGQKGFAVQYYTHSPVETLLAEHKIRRLDFSEWEGGL